jgi:hypothetical protein
MIHAVAELISESTPLTLIRPEQGLLKFRFEPGERVEFRTGSWRLTSSGKGAHAGELGMNRSGQLAMVLSEGTFLALRAGVAWQTEVTPGAPLVVLEQIGRGDITTAGDRMVDRAGSWQEGTLKGKCLTAQGEAHRILDNGLNTLTIQGAWKLATGSYEYTITDCDSRMNATQQGPAAGVSRNPSRRLLVVAGAGAAAALLIITGVSAGGGISTPPTSPTKSPS